MSWVEKGVKHLKGNDFPTGFGEKNRPQQCKDAQLCTFEEGRQQLAATHGLAATRQPVVGPIHLDGASQKAPWEPPNKPAVATANFYD